MIQSVHMPAIKQAGIFMSATAAGAPDPIDWDLDHLVKYANRESAKNVEIYNPRHIRKDV